MPDSQPCEHRPRWVAMTALRVVGGTAVVGTVCLSLASAKWGVMSLALAACAVLLLAATLTPMRRDRVAGGLAALGGLLCSALVGYYLKRWLDFQQPPQGVPYRGHSGLASLMAPAFCALLATGVGSILLGLLLTRTRPRLTS